MNPLRTEWFDKVDRDCPLADYPRPQFVRKDWMCLNGAYDYAVTGDSDQFPTTYEGKILVPFSVESDISGVNFIKFCSLVCVHLENTSNTLFLILCRVKYV